MDNMFIQNLQVKISSTLCPTPESRGSNLSEIRLMSGTMNYTYSSPCCAEPLPTGKHNVFHGFLCQSWSKTCLPRPQTRSMFWVRRATRTFGTTTLNAPLECVLSNPLCHLSVLSPVPNLTNLPPWSKVRSWSLHLASVTIFAPFFFSTVSLLRHLHYLIPSAYYLLITSSLGLFISLGQLYLVWTIYASY